MVYRAGAIGRTGRGNYGHSIDMAWTEVPNVEYIAVADEDLKGRDASIKRTGAKRGYGDYREMLAKERLDVVSVSPRWPDCHREMVVACAEAGVKGVLSDKPLAPTLADADALLSACRRHGTKVAIAHQGRVTPPVVRARELVQEGAIGKLLTMRARGKEDQRGGGVDLMVLGTHILDLMRYFAGDPLWCCGDVTIDGRPITAADVTEGPEGIGLTAGNQVMAMYGFADGVRGIFESFHDQEGGGRRMGVDLYGTKGILLVRGMMEREVHLFRSSLYSPADQRSWEPIVEPAWEALSSEARLVHTNRLIARDLLAAIEEDREPQVSGEGGRWSLEMIMAAWASSIGGARVTLPLADRGNPLSKLQG